MYRPAVPLFAISLGLCGCDSQPINSAPSAEEQELSDDAKHKIEAVESQKQIPGNIRQGGVEKVEGVDAVERIGDEMDGTAGKSGTEKIQMTGVMTAGPTQEGMALLVKAIRISEAQ